MNLKLKNRILIVLLFLAGTCSNVFSQVDSTKGTYIYTSPLTTIDYFSRPMLTLGAEHILFNKFGVSAEFGIKYKDVDTYDSTIVDSKGYSSRVESKYYDISLIKSKNLRDYVSLEFRYIKDDYNSQFDYFTDSTAQTLITESYAIQKDIYIGNVKYGIVMNMNKTFYMDLFSGIGLRYREVENISRTFDPKLGHIHSSPHSFWAISDFEEHSGLQFNLSFGFKLGVKF